jgi:hypothetical protein
VIGKDADAMVSAPQRAVPTTISVGEADSFPYKSLVQQH